MHAAGRTVPGAGRHGVRPPAPHGPAAPTIHQQPGPTTVGRTATLNAPATFDECVLVVDQQSRNGQRHEPDSTPSTSYSSSSQLNPRFHSSQRGGHRYRPGGRQAAPQRSYPPSRNHRDHQHGVGFSAGQQQQQDGQRYDNQGQWQQQRQGGQQESYSQHPPPPSHRHQQRGGRNRSWTRVIPPQGSPVAAQLLQRIGVGHLADMPMGSLQRRRGPRPYRGKEHALPLIEYVRQQVQEHIQEGQQLLAEQQRELEDMRRQLDLLTQRQAHWGFAAPLQDAPLPASAPPAPVDGKHQAAGWSAGPAPQEPAASPQQVEDLDQHSPGLNEQQQLLQQQEEVAHEAAQQQDVPALALWEDVQQQQAQLAQHLHLADLEQQQEQEQQPAEPYQLSSPGQASASVATVTEASPSAGLAHPYPHHQQEQQQQLLQQQLAEAQQLKQRLQALAQQQQQLAAGAAAGVVPDHSYDPLRDAVPGASINTSISAVARRVVEVLSRPELGTAELDSIGLYQCHQVLKLLVNWGQVQLLPQLAGYIRSRRDTNEHTVACIFDAYTYAGRLDWALQLWDVLREQRVDIGPIAASTLLRCCARERDVAAALRVFEQLMHSRVTYNRFSYNCVIHLCGLAGRVEEALGIYSLMRLETEEKNLPDEFTYSGMVRAMLASGKLEGLQTLFENALEDNVELDDRLYVHFLTAAARAGEVPLAQFIFQHRNSSKQRSSSSSGRQHQPPGAAKAAQQEQEEVGGDLYVVNALLAAYARVGDLKTALRVYQRHVVAQQLSPDAYTFSSLLTCTARSSGVTLDELEGIRSWMKLYNVPLSAVTGTSLISAYRRVHTWGAPRQAADVQQLSKQQRRRQGGKGRQQQQRQQVAELQDHIAAAAARVEAGEPAAAADAGVQVAGLELFTASPAVAAAAAELQGVELPAPVADMLHSGSVKGFALARAVGVFQRLQATGVANAQACTVMLAFYLEAGCVDAYKQLWKQVEGSHIVLTAEAAEVLARAAMEAGQEQLHRDMQSRVAAAVAGGQQLRVPRVSSKALAFSSSSSFTSSGGGAGRAPTQPAQPAAVAAAAPAAAVAPVQAGGVGVPAAAGQAQLAAPPPLVQAARQALVATDSSRSASRGSSSSTGSSAGRLHRPAPQVQRPAWHHGQQQQKQPHVQQQQQQRQSAVGHAVVQQQQQAAAQPPQQQPLVSGGTREQLLVQSSDMHSTSELQHQQQLPLVQPSHAQQPVQPAVAGVAQNTVQPATAPVKQAAPSGRQAQRSARKQQLWELF